MLSSEDKWKSETLDEVFGALALSPELSEILVYKGARVLRLLLNEVTRASLDIDASFATIAAGFPEKQENLERLRTLVQNAITAHFESQRPVRYTLQGSEIRNRRRSGNHPRGWNVYWLDLRIRDLGAPDFLDAAPALRIEIAAPELLSEHSVAPLELNGQLIQAVTLERMAGEKLRAFLSSLPTYRGKIREKMHVPRARDLYDLVRIRRRRPLEDRRFWEISGGEFYLACQSRCIDCEGIRTFKEEWDTTAQVYRSDPTIPDDVPLAEVERTLEEVVAFLMETGRIPFAFELPEI
jgi:predicted nucleotidyltransferase component of viral defense system